jgi:hypothetical protein
MEEEPVEQPQLYDGTVLEAEADGDVVIPPAPMAANEAPPALVAPAPNAVGGDPDDSGDDSGDEDEDDSNADENPVEEDDENPRYRGAEYHKHSTEEEIVSSVFFFVRYYNTWGTPWGRFMLQSTLVSQA